MAINGGYDTNIRLRIGLVPRATQVESVSLMIRPRRVESYLEHRKNSDPKNERLCSRGVNFLVSTKMVSSDSSAARRGARTRRRGRGFRVKMIESMTV
jgi:hypothetical protein